MSYFSIFYNIKLFSSLELLWNFPFCFLLYSFKGAILSCTRLQRAQMEGASLRGYNFEDPGGTRANLEGRKLSHYFQLTAL